MFVHVSWCWSRGIDSPVGGGCSPSDRWRPLVLAVELCVELVKISFSGLVKQLVPSSGSCAQACRRWLVCPPLSGCGRWRDRWSRGVYPPVGDGCSTNDWWRFEEPGRRRAGKKTYGRTCLRIYTVRIRARRWCGRLRAFFEKEVLRGVDPYRWVVVRAVRRVPHALR